MARKRIGDNKIRFGLTLRESFLSDKYYMVLIPMNSGDPSFKNWTEALKDIWPEIQKTVKEGWLITGKPEKPKITRKHQGLTWKVFKRDKYTCKHCGSQENLSIDHIKPVTKGGTDDIENLQTLCKRCNSKKGNKYEMV